MPEGNTAIGERERSDQERRGREPRRRAQGIGASERAMSTEDGRVGNRDEMRRARDGRGPEQGRARRRALRDHTQKAAPPLAGARETPTNAATVRHDIEVMIRNQRARDANRRWTSGEPRRDAARARRPRAGARSREAPCIESTHAKAAPPLAGAKETTKNAATVRHDARAEGSGASSRAMSTEDGRAGSRDETRRKRDRRARAEAMARGAPCIESTRARTAPPWAGARKATTNAATVRYDA